MASNRLDAVQNAQVTVLMDNACGELGCWEWESFEDAGVVAYLGPAWISFMADRHFGGACRGNGDRTGGFCDGIGLQSQTAGHVRLVEAKAGPRISDARAQLRVGAEYLLNLGGFRASEMVAECHVKRAPRSSMRQKPLVVGRRKARIPFSVWADGKRIV